MSEYVVFLPYILAFIAGIFVKWVDWIDDDKKGKNPIKWPLAIAYGIIIGFIISSASFAIMFLAALIAQMFARKVDTRAHFLGFVMVVLSLLYFGLPNIEYAFLVYFLVLAFADEADFIGRLRPLTEYRPFLKIGALLMILLGRFDFLIAILCFDLGYELFVYLTQKKTKKKR